ncbi:hypothetical protein O3P69_001007 [Scylla paramamosain]|uniref:Uncharacterized protein n=1 Tax=Scylla paramamosain TaxID=85552 RepID=A0AAW0US41_SCYPA
MGATSVVTVMVSLPVQCSRLVVLTLDKDTKWKVTVYALLDSSSTRTFCSKKMIHQLGLQETKEMTVISTLVQTEHRESTCVTLMVAGLHTRRAAPLRLKGTFVEEAATVGLQDLLSEMMRRFWEIEDRDDPERMGISIEDQRVCLNGKQNRCLMGLRTRLSRDEALRDRYLKEMEELMSIGYTEKVSLEGCSLVWSPASATFALRQTLKEGGVTASEAKRSFYVVDLLLSTDSADEAIRCAHELQDCLERGSFHLTKWMSNSKKITATIPQRERSI